MFFVIIVSLISKLRSCSLFRNPQSIQKIRVTASNTATCTIYYEAVGGLTHYDKLNELKYD